MQCKLTKNAGLIYELFLRVYLYLGVHIIDTGTLAKRGEQEPREPQKRFKIYYTTYFIMIILIL